MTARTDVDHGQLQLALSNHQRELTKIDDRIWIDEHNEMLTDLQQRIKGLPSVSQNNPSMIMEQLHERVAKLMRCFFVLRTFLSWSNTDI
jgi:hypothetical protein